MEEYEIVPEAALQPAVTIKCRAPSIIAAMKRAATLLPPDCGFEIINRGRCVYKSDAASAML